MHRVVIDGVTYVPLNWLLDRDNSDTARLAWIAEHAYATRSTRDGRDNAVVWEHANLESCRVAIDSKRRAVNAEGAARE